MQFGIHTLQVRNCHFLLQDHLIKADNEVGVQEPTMEDTQAQASTDEFEIVQVLRIDTRGRINLEGIVVMCGIFKEAVEGIEHLM